MSAWSWSVPWLQSKLEVDSVVLVADVSLDYFGAALIFATAGSMLVVAMFV